MDLKGDQKQHRLLVQPEQDPPPLWGSPPEALVFLRGSLHTHQNGCPLQKEQPQVAGCGGRKKRRRGHYSPGFHRLTEGRRAARHVLLRPGVTGHGWIYTWLLLGNISHFYYYCGLVVEIPIHLTAQINLCSPSNVNQVHRWAKIVCFVLPCGCGSKTGTQSTLVNGTKD